MLVSYKIRWEPKGLTGHGKTIFNALKDLVDDVSGQFFNKNGYDIKAYLQDLVRLYFQTSVDKIFLHALDLW